MLIEEEDIAYLKTLTVLYVEDDDDVREQLDQFLLRRTGRLISVTNGAAGLEAFRLNNPHIILTDILMPMMDGLEMARSIRSLSPAVPIIVITAFEQTDYLLSSIEIGIDRYIIKPVNSEKLNEALLHCAHQLRAEEQLKLQRKLEAEVQKIYYREALGILSAGVAHDLNNLLQVILGYVTLARMNAESGGKVDEYLQEAEKGSGQARELGQRLLTLAKGGEVFTDRGSLGPLIRATVNATLDGTSVARGDDVLGNTRILMAVAKTLQVEITRRFDIEDSLPCIDYDKAQMQQVFTCLTINAIEAMPAGGDLRIAAGTCTISETEGMPLSPGDYVHISFSDTGTGIIAENLPKIFAPYFTTKQVCSQKGMGLSLALCETIIRKHGGSITAESPPGKGATFHILLPVAPENAP